MGFSIENFTATTVNPEFICLICEGVLENPVVLEGCEHQFCKHCIESWITKSNTCPVDRSPVTWLKTPQRSFMNLVNSLQRHCPYMSYGCEKVISLSDLSSHETNCGANPGSGRTYLGQAAATTSTQHIVGELASMKLELKAAQIKIKNLEVQNLALQRSVTLYPSLDGVRNDMAMATMQGKVKVFFDIQNGSGGEQIGRVIIQLRHEAADGSAKYFLSGCNSRLYKDKAVYTINNTITTGVHGGQRFMPLEQFQDEAAASQRTSAHAKDWRKGKVLLDNYGRFEICLERNNYGPIPLDRIYIGQVIGGSEVLKKIYKVTSATTTKPKIGHSGQL